MAVIEVRNLRKSYHDHTAVADVSFSVESGEIFGVLGPNGAGKTTTVECIEGLRRRDGGSVSVLGLDPERDRDAVHRVLGAQLQESQLQPKLTVSEAVEEYRSFYPYPADGDALIDRLGLADKRGTAYEKLSGGQKQRLSIVLALIGNPQVAVLDELTTGLDPQARRDTWSLIEDIRDSGVTVLLVTHFMEEAERLCDRVAIIDAGRVVTVDTPANLAEASQVEQRLGFRPSKDFVDSLLTELPEVARLEHNEGEITVVGTGNLLYAVTSALARNEIVAEHLRADQASLDDAFVALVGRR